MAVRSNCGSRFGPNQWRARSTAPASVARCNSWAGPSVGTAPQQRQGQAGCRACVAPQVPQAKSGSTSTRQAGQGIEATVEPSQRSSHGITPWRRRPRRPRWTALPHMGLRLRCRRPVGITREVPQLRAQCADQDPRRCDRSGHARCRPWPSPTSGPRGSMGGGSAEAARWRGRKATCGASSDEEANPQVMLRVQLGTIGTSLAQTGSPISQTGNQSMLDWFAHLTDRKPVHARLVPVFPFMESSCHFIIIILPRLSAYPFMESSCRFNPQAALRVHINKAMEPPIRLARTSYHN